MRGVKSNGMLLAASDATHENVELLTPPEGSAPGERVWFGTEDDKESQGESGMKQKLQLKFSTKRCPLSLAVYSLDGYKHRHKKPKHPYILGYLPHYLYAFKMTKIPICRTFSTV